MKKLAVCTALVLLASCTASLKPGVWEKDTYKAMNSLLDSRARSGSYAVFDCDNTTVIHDVTNTLMLYMIENLRFASAPEHLFLDGLKDVDFPLEGLGMSAKEMGRVLSEEYFSLKKELNDSLFSDFKARFLAFISAVGDNYDYGTLCLWEPSLAIGFSQEELEALGRESLSYWLSTGKAWDEEWVSPDGRFYGTAHKGLVMTEEMKDLYTCLTSSGITPYVCSASPEWLVELFCSGMVPGFELPEDQVFGLRFVENEDGTWSYDADYPQPYMEGKVACIDKYMAVRHQGLQPVLVAGDSNGDVAMLTSYPDMQVGLVIDWDREGAIDELASCGNGKIFSQKFSKNLQ